MVVKVGGGGADTANHVPTAAIATAACVANDPASAGRTADGISADLLGVTPDARGRPNTAAHIAELQVPVGDGTI